MVHKEQQTLPPAANRLRQRVEKWRQSKQGQFSLTPVELWDAVTLQRYHAMVEENPKEWMPWNYANNLAGIGLAG